MLGKEAIHTSVVGFSVVIAGLASLATLAVLARLLPQPEFGAYMFFVACVAILNVCGPFGINIAALRFVAECIGNREWRAAATVGRLSMIVGAIASGIIAVGVLSAVGGGCFGDELPELIGWRGTVLAFLWLWCVGVRCVSGDVFRGFGWMVAYAVSSGAFVWTTTLAGVVGLSYVVCPVTLTMAIGVTALASAIAAAVNLWILACRLGFAGRLMGSSGKFVLGFLKVGLGGMMAQFGLVAQNYVLTFILVATQGPAAGGRFGAAHRLVEVGAVSLAAAAAVMGPRVAAFLASGDKQAAERLLGFAAALGTVPVALMAVAALVVGKLMLGAVYGASYQTAYVLLVLLAMARVATGLRGVGHVILLLTGSERQMNLIAWSGLCVLASAAWLLIPRWGLAGAGMAAFLCSAWQSAGIWTVVARTTGLRCDPQWRYAYSYAEALKEAAGRLAVAGRIRW